MSQDEDASTQPGPPTGDEDTVGALRLREARYRTILEATRTVLWAADPEGRFTATQPEWARFTGQDPQAQLGFGWLEAIHADDRGRFVREWAEARARTEVFLTEVRVHSVERSEYRECELRTAPLLQEDGTVREWVGHLMDVSELRRAQAAARQREVMLSALVENAPIPIFVKDAEGRYVLASRHVTGLLAGDPDDSIVGRSDEELLPWNVAREVRTNDLEVLDSGEIRIFEEMVPGPEGDDHWWLTTKFPLPATTGRALAGIAVDVTDRRQLAEERAEAIRRRDGFLAMLSHELRNPMQAILHAVRMVDADEVDVSREAKAIIRRQASHVSRMLGDLLDVSRMTHGRLTLADERVAMEQVVDAAVETVKSVAVAGDVEVVLDVQRPRVRGDETRLVQVLVNLLRNAVSHSDPGGTVHVRVWHEDGWAIAEVRDQGTGIEAEDLERIFDPFYQRPQTIARSEGGLGLGLSLSRTLVQLHGGKLFAESAGLGHGARFEMRLPVDQSTDVTAPPPPPKDTPSDRLRFVVVEDNDDSREMLVLWLRSRGHEVVACEDGESGLEAILEERPDVAILDIGLPGMTGYEIARAVRERWEGPRLTMVAVTGYGRPEDRERVFEAGFDDHLVKPVEVEVLEELLARAARVGSG
ncbi:MAG: hypothetical protein CMN30_05875 [Sandaracinus sp.]|nr:hypothetical protein [Sandaracinus sp.]|tara:strand:+ start:915 stop:2849 length:1935 start_codon:yes stop_codon:yes gene_type:complete